MLVYYLTDLKRMPTRPKFRVEWSMVAGILMNLIASLYLASVFDGRIEQASGFPRALLCPLLLFYVSCLTPGVVIFHDYSPEQSGNRGPLRVLRNLFACFVGILFAAIIAAMLQNGALAASTPCH